MVLRVLETIFGAEEALKVARRTVVEPLGSFRRKAKDSGDVDIMVAPPDWVLYRRGSTPKELLGMIIGLLHAEAGVPE